MMRFLFLLLVFGFYNCSDRMVQYDVDVFVKHSDIVQDGMRLSIKREKDTINYVYLKKDKKSDFPVYLHIQKIKGVDSMFLYYGEEFELTKEYNFHVNNAVWKVQLYCDEYSELYFNDKYGLLLDFLNLAVYKTFSVDSTTNALIDSILNIKRKEFPPPPPPPPPWDVQK